VSRRRPTWVIVALAPALALACNVFVSVDRCDTDADCPPGATCDPGGRYCLLVTVAPAPDAPPSDTALDAGPDVPLDVASDADGAPPLACDPTAPFGSIHLVAGFEANVVSSARFTSSETVSLYSYSNGCTFESCADLFYATRPDRDAAFGGGAALPAVDCPGVSEYWPTITSDGKVLFFESSRRIDGGCSQELPRVWSATRVNPVADFDPPKIQGLFAIDSGTEGAPYLHPGGRSLYFTSNARGGKGGLDIFVAKLDALGFATAIDNVDAINSASDENMAVVSLDDLALYFGRPSAGGDRDIWLSTRATPADAFGPPSLVTELSGATDEWPSWISDDRCRLYFVSNRDSGADASGIAAYRLWVAERPALF
jgi:hypothetical protein